MYEEFPGWINKKTTKHYENIVNSDCEVFKKYNVSKIILFYCQIALVFLSLCWEKHRGVWDKSPFENVRVALVHRTVRKGKI